MIFFEFCQTMLERYRNDPTVFSVNGCSLGYHNPKEPYGATRYFNMWGWATWRRSYELVQKTWSAYTPEMGVDNDPTMKKNLHLPYISKEMQNGDSIGKVCLTMFIIKELIPFGIINGHTLY